MRYEHLERLHVSLTVKSPLFIGSGQKLQAKEILLDARAHTALIPSMPDMIDAIQNSWRRGAAEDYIRFVMDARQKDLRAFLVGHGMTLNPVPGWVKYTVAVQPEIRGINTLLTFTRDPEGRAYIPGSSIKGAIRTALIAARMSADHSAALCREMAANPRDRRASAAENALRTLNCQPLRPADAVNDLLRALEISDSQPFPPEALTVCQRHWLSENGEERPGQSPVYTECLRPGAQTAFYLTVDHSLWPAGEDAMATLRRALTDWDACIRRAYDVRFAPSLADSAACDLPAPGVTSAAPIVLGGGTGFQRKSLVYRAATSAEAARLTRTVLEAQFFKTYKPRPNNRIHPYKFKAAKYAGQYWPMGRCELSF